MTYNLRFATESDGENAWSKRKDAVIALIKSHDPDILGSQEGLASQVDELRQAMRSHAVVGVGRDDGLRKGEYSAIFYRRERFGLREGGTRWISDTPDKAGSMGPGTTLPRVFSWGEFFLAEGGRILVMNCHLDHQSAEARLLGAKQLAEFAKSRPSLPTIISGDFNCSFGSEPIDWLQKQGGFLAPKPSDGIMGTFNGFDPKATTGSMIDFIFASPHWTVTEFRVDRSLKPDGRVPSDHFPVIATLRMKSK